jgi:hypothetical protein
MLDLLMSVNLLCETVKKEKEIHATFACTSNCKFMARVSIKCLAKMEKALNYRV